MHLYLKYQSPNTFSSIDIAQGKVFQNYVKVQDQGHKSWYRKKGDFIMHLFLKYQSPYTFGSKDIAQVKVLQN
jgi:hypothetical protein